MDAGPMSLQALGTPELSVYTVVSLYPQSSHGQVKGLGFRVLETL